MILKAELTVCAVNTKFDNSHSIKPWPNKLTSRCKFAKPELAYGLVKGSQMVRKSQKALNFTHIIG